MMPKVSILVPIYNVAPFILKCCKSLFNQTYQNCEFVFVNDCTPDNSIELLNSLVDEYQVREKTKIINHLHNKGLAEARNTGVTACSGEYIMHVDSDDYLENDAVEKSVNEILKNKADAVIFSMRHVFKNTSRIEHSIIPNNRIEYLKQLICKDTIVCMCGGLYKTSLYRDNSIEAVPGLNMGEDYSTKPRLLYFSKRTVALDLPLYNYVHYNESSYTSNFSQHNVDNLVKAIDVLEKFYKNKPEFSELSKSFLRAKMMAKVQLFNIWSLSKEGIEGAKNIEVAFPLSIIRVTPLQYRPIVLLSRLGCYRLIRLYVLLGIHVKNMLS